MNIPEAIRRQFEGFSLAMEHSPNRHRAIYCCVHAALVLVGIVFVMVGYPAAVLAVVVLSLDLTGQDDWQVRLSRRCALAGLIILAICAAIMLLRLLLAGWCGLASLFLGLVVFALIAVSLALWHWAANSLYDAQFRLPSEDTGPW